MLSDCMRKSSQFDLAYRSRNMINFVRNWKSPWPAQRTSRLARDPVVVGPADEDAKGHPNDKLGLCFLKLIFIVDMHDIFDSLRAQRSMHFSGSERFALMNEFTAENAIESIHFFRAHA